MDKSLILKQIKEHYKFKTDGEFANFLGIKQNSLSNWSTRNSIDYERIISKCEDIDANWLLTGKGSMLKNDKKSSFNQSITGDSNIQSGNDTNITGDYAKQIKKLELELQECKTKLEEKDKTISQLVNLMSSK